MRIIIAGILGGIILFIWSAISWMALPWHMTTLHSFKDEKAVSELVQSNTSISGIYVLPFMSQNGQAKDAQTAKGPMIFASVHQEGMSRAMTLPMIISLITQIIAACFVAWMVSKTDRLNYFGRVVFVVVFAFAAGLVVDMPYWNWFGFDANYTLVQMSDLLIGWFLAGLVLATSRSR